MIEEVKVEGGKYTFQYDTETGRLTCLRHGEPWRDFIGDKAVFALFYSLYDKREKMTDLSAIALTNHEMTQKENVALKALIQKLLNKVNIVTAPFRHTGEVGVKPMVELCNRQIEVEEELRKYEK